MRLDIRATSEVLANIAVIAGIVIALVQYQAAIQGEKVERSLKFVERLTGPELRAQWQAIEQPWRSYSLQQLSQINRRSDPVNVLATSFVDGSDEVRGSLISIVEVIDLAAVCSAEGICDGEVIKNHLGTQIDRLGCLYGAPVRKLRASHLLPELGKGMSEIMGQKQCVI